MPISYDDYKKKYKKQIDENNKKRLKEYQVNVSTLKKANTKKKEKKRSWFNSGALDDGYDFGDITKTILGTAGDVGVNAVRGVSQAGEGLAKLAVGGVAEVSDLIGADKYADKLRNRLAGKDEEFNKRLEKTTISPWLNKASNYLDNYSLIGEKSDDLVSSVGNLGASMAAQTVGVPWWVTMGGSSAGQEFESALKSGATTKEAWGSAAISGASEVLFERLSGGIKFGGRTLDEGAKRLLSNAITNKTAQTLTKFGFDVVGEGMEEVLTEITSNIGKKLTYEDEKTWGETLASEEALDNYLEAFIGGAVMGGGFNALKLNNTFKTGRDYDTGLTQNEQLVLDNATKQKTTEIQKQKAVEERVNKIIEEREKTFGNLNATEKKNIKDSVMKQLEAGEIDFSKSELSKKEIATIEEEIRGDLEKGNLSIETIEDTLLGEKKAQIKTLEQELANTKGDAEKAQIQAKINELQRANATEMKNILSKDVLLQNSYREANLKKEKFTYEAAETDSEYKKALAEDFTKVANNTTKSHELFETLSKIAEDKQTSYGVINNDQLKQLGYDIEGKDVNGLVRVNEDGTQKVLINVDSEKAINRIVGHETTHLLEGTKEYTELQEMVKQYATTKGEYDARIKALTKLYEGTNANVENEVTADLVGDYLFTDADFVNNLSVQKPNIFQKIYNEIKHLYKLATAGSKEARQLEKVKKAFDKAYKQNAVQSATDTKYSVSDNQGRTLSKEQQEYFKDSKVVDENGNLKVLYHGTTADFNKFSYEYLGTNGTNYGVGFYLTDKLDTAKGYADRGENGKVMELYVDITNPLAYGGSTISPEQFQKFVEAINEKSNGQLFEDFGGEQVEKGSAEYEAVLNDIMMDFEYGGDDIDVVESILSNEVVSREEGYKILKETTGKDGIIVETSSGDNALGNVYIPFLSSQIKNIDNTNPTSDPDIRYSLSEATDNQGRTLTKEQQEYFKDSKVRDENGNLEVVYHGSKKAGFTTFYTKDGVSFYTSDSNVAKTYSGSNEFVDTKKLNSIEEVNQWLEELGLDNVSIEKNNNRYGYEFSDKEYVLLDTDIAVEELGDDLLAGYTNEEDLLKKIKQDIIRQFGNEEAGGIYEGYLNLKNPLVINGEGKLWRTIPYKNGYGNGTATTDMIVEDVLESNKKGTTNYDGIIFNNIIDEGMFSSSTKGKPSNVYVTFNSNQFKAKDNYNPTSDADIRYSLGNQDVAPSKNDIFGSDIKLQVEEAIAPLQEVVTELTEQVETLQQEIAPVKQTTEDYSPVTEADLPMMEQQYEESFNSIDDSDMPSEIEDTIPEVEDTITETKSLFATRDYDEVGNRKVKAYQFDNPEVKPYFKEAAYGMYTDLELSTKGERYVLGDISQMGNGDYRFSGTKRHTANDIAELLDGLDGKYKLSYDEIRKGLDAIIDDEGAENNAASKRIEFYLDQRLRNGYLSLDGIEVPPNQEYLDTLKELEFNDYYSNIPIDESMIPSEAVEEQYTPIKNVSNSENIAPVSENNVKPLSMEDIKNNKEIIKKEPVIVEQQTAQILDEKPTAKNKDRRLKTIATVNLVDKGYYISKLARETNNRQLDALWDNTLLSNAQAQEVLGEGRFKLNAATKTYEKVGDSVYEIFEGLENTNKVKDFNEYMYHKLNVERMSLEDNAKNRMKNLKDGILKDYTLEDINSMSKMQIREDAKQEIKDIVNAAKEYKKLNNVKNKPVFGYGVDANNSIEIVSRLEQNNPEFSDYAKKVYEYESGDYSDLSLLVESGVLSQEDADYYKAKYESYVPIIRDIDAGMMESQLFGKRASAGKIIKNATGGSQDIIPLKDAIAIKTMLVQRTANMNKLGLELMHTLNPEVVSETMSAENIIEDISNNKDIIQAGTNGKNPTMTVYENGVKKTFEIPMEIYEALKTNYDSVSKMTIKPFNAFSNFKRNVLTQYNPFFMVTNAIKDSQDILINSQHPAATYKAIPEAIAQLKSKGYWYKEMQNQGLFQDTYYDNQGGFDTTKKGLSKISEFYPLKKISEINDFIERVPRMAEYIASRKTGASIEVASLDASRVTTNFKAGGDWTKFFNRNGATFLNASIQGAVQQVRNVQEAHQKGLKGYMGLATKFVVAALPAVLLNNLVWDDDEEYEELSDYIKDNYYIIGKYGDGEFIRIPKGRMTAVIQKSIGEMQNLVTGDDEVDLGSYLELVVNNIAPSNPIENNIFSPFINTKLFNKDDSGKTWYGGDLVPTRLQDKPAAEQYDETTDEFSKWLGKKLNLSPIKINNLIDQNTGVIGDMLLPMMTAESKTKNSNPIFAGLEDKFTANVTFDNKSSSDFYSVKEQTNKKANSFNATEEDVLRNKYLNSVQAEMNDIYKEIREVQNSDLGKKEKYAQVKELRTQINNMSKKALEQYNNISTKDSYSSVGDKEYYKDSKGEWKSIKEEEATALNSMGMTSDDKNNYFNAKNSITNIVKDYKGSKEGLNEEDDSYESEASLLSGEKKVSIINAIRNAGLNDEQTAYLYDKYYASTEKLNTVVKTGIGMNAYLDLEAQNFKADVDSKGKTISGSKKDKVFDYINSMGIGFEQKAILAKMYYPSYDEYNYDIINYLNNDDSITYSDMENILKSLGFEVKSDGTITWD